MVRDFNAKAQRREGKDIALMSPPALQRAERITRDARIMHVTPPLRSADGATRHPYHLMKLGLPRWRLSGLGFCRTATVSAELVAAERFLASCLFDPIPDY